MYWQPALEVPASAHVDARRIAWRPSTHSSTGRRSTCRRPASRSSAAGTGRTTSRRTTCSTAASARWPTATGCGSLGVRYVVLSDAPPDYSSRAEAALVRGGVAGMSAGLPRAARDDVPGGGREADRHRARRQATVVGMSPTRLFLRVGAPGRIPASLSGTRRTGARSRACVAERRGRDDPTHHVQGGRGRASTSR